MAETPEEDGIIPAYAGSTASWPETATRSPDHPRIRGEHRCDISLWPMVSGSSPHTRGAPLAPSRLLVGRGIIPAYAGSTRFQRRLGVEQPDHPRIRGEHDCGVMVIAGTDGSSPHTRGARFSLAPSCLMPRIIPAYAGSTASPGAEPAPHPDHPRIRGEHMSMSVFEMTSPGSSPHTRGAPT